MAEFDYSRIPEQGLRLLTLAHQAHYREDRHEPTIAAFKAELDGADQESLEALRGRARGDAREDIAMVTALFLRSILRRNQGLSVACLAAAEAIVAEATEDEGGLSSTEADEDGEGGDGSAKA